MASEAELADLFVTLRAVNAPLLRAFEESTAAGESMVTALTGMFAEIDAMLVATAESAAALRTELAGVGESAGAAGAVGGGAAVAGAAEGTAVGAATAGAGAAAEADAATVSTAANEEVAAWDRVLAEMARVQAETAATAQADATEWSTMATRISAANEEMIASTKAYSDEMVAAGVKVDEAAAASSTVGSKLSTVTGALKGPAIAAGIVGVAVVKMAADFQTSTTRLVTSGGEVASQLQTDQQGILALAGQVGYSAEALSGAMYKITSAGQSGTQALDTLKAAAQGAKTENANLTTVADAVSTAMIDYKGKVGSAADVTSKLVAATSQGKTNFQDLAGAMSAILPKASAAGISFTEILGDLASMTQHGISAQQAAENLADSISHMQNPTAVMSKEMAALGLNSTDLAQNLGKVGLSGTLDQVAAAVQRDMGAGSTKVILNLQSALKGLSPAVQAGAQAVMNGTQSLGAFTAATKGLPVEQAKQVQAFATLYNSFHQIGSTQMTGAQVMQTYAGAMAKATGDSASLNVALMVTGQNSGNTSKAISTIGKATADAQGNVQGWTQIQGTFNQKMSEAKGGLGALGIEVGDKLLPVVSKIAGVVGNASTWLSKHGQAATILAGIIGGILVTALVAYTAKILWSIGETAVGFVVDIAKGTWWVLTKIGQFVAVSASAASEAFATAGRWVFANATVLASEVADGAVWVATAVGNFVSVSAAAVVQAAKSSAAWLASTAKMAGQGLASLASWVSGVATQFGAAAAAAVTNAAASSAAWLANAATMTGKVVAQAVTWALGTIAEYAAVATSAVISAAAAAAAWIAANLAIIVATGGLILILAAVVLAVIYVATHWKEIWAAIKTDFALAVKFVGEKVDDIVNFFKNLATGVGHFFADAGKWLWNAGKAILDGLLNGLKAAWNAVTGFIGGIGNWISSHKGPIEVDRQLLTPHGNAIMQGLLTGLQAGGKHVVSYLDNFTQSLGATSGGAVQVGMQVTGMSSPSGMAPFAGGSPAAVGGNGITVNVYVAGSVSTENQLVRAVQKGILQLSGRNSGFGLAPAFQ